MLGNLLTYQLESKPVKFVNFMSMSKVTFDNTVNFRFYDFVIRKTMKYDQK